MNIKAIIANKTINIEFLSIEIADNKTIVKCDRPTAMTIAKFAIVHRRNYNFNVDGIWIHGNVLSDFFVYNGIMCKSMLSSIGMDVTFKQAISSLKLLKQNSDDSREKLKDINGYVDGLFQDISNTLDAAISRFDDLDRSFKHLHDAIYNFTKYKFNTQSAAYIHAVASNNFYEYVDNLHEYVKNCLEDRLKKCE